MFANHHVQSLSPTLPQRWGDGDSIFPDDYISKSWPPGFEKDIPRWSESGRIIPLKFIFIINCLLL